MTVTTQQLQPGISTLPGPAGSPPGLTGGGVHTQGGGAVIDGVTQAQYQTVDGVYRQVQANETVQGQLQGILASDSPLMTQARAKALEGMQARGLVNSAMAESAGQAAVIEKGIQIATPDAATYAQAARDNQMTGNETNRFNAGQFGDNSRFNAGEGNKLNLQKKADAAALERQRVADAASLERTRVSEAGALQRTQLSNQAQMAVAEMNKAAQIASATMSANAQLEASRINAQAQYAVTEMQRQYSREVTQTQLGANIVSDFAKTVTAINTNPDLDFAARQKLINDQVATSNMGLSLINSTHRIADTQASGYGANGGNSGPNMPSRYAAPRQRVTTKPVYDYGGGRYA